MATYSVAAGMIDNNSAGLESSGQCLNHLPARSIDDGNGIGPGIRDVEPLAILRHRNAAGNMADWNARENFAGRCVKHSDFIAILANDVEKAAV